MSETTGIEWATSTGNPWIGCTKVSPGCKNCYAAELDANKFSRTMGGGTKDNPISHWGKGAPRVRTKGFWKDAVKWNREAVDWDGIETFGGVPISGAGERPRIFPSLCDWLDDEVPIEWLADFLQLIHDTPNLDWILLTKRPENFVKRTREAMHVIGDVAHPWTPDGNVRIGVSVENQAMADLRIPQLLQIPARVRFLSVEPLLERVNLGRWVHDDVISCVAPVIDWVIVGGESGKDRRDPGVEPIVEIANQCVAAGVPCFVKQDCAFKPGQQGRIPDAIWKLKQLPTC